MKNDLRKLLDVIRSIEESAADKKKKEEKKAFFNDLADMSSDKVELDEAIPKSTTYAVVHSSSKKIIDKGNKKDMLKKVKALNAKEISIDEGKSNINESGETYLWTAHYRDGSTKKLNITTDEVDQALSVFKRHHPGNIVKVTTDWKPVDTSSYFKSGSWGGAIPDPRPTEPLGRPVDNPWVREQSLAEAIAEIEEDMLSKVKRDLTQYLDRLEKKVQKDCALLPKHNKTVDQDPTAVDTMTTFPPASIQDSAMSEPAAVKSITLENGSVLEIHGDQLRGFEIRRGGRSLPTRFPNLDHAQMAVDLYRQRRDRGNSTADYVEER
jgi:hypothetical protein